MSLRRKLLIAALCLLSCSAIALQVIYESGAIVQGFPAPKFFLLLFWWQVTSIPTVIVGTVVGLRWRSKYSWIPLAALIAAAVYPLVVATTALWPTEWSGWITAFKAWPKESCYRLSMAVLPGLFTALLCILFLKQLRLDKDYQGV